MSARTFSFAATELYRTWFQVSGGFSTVEPMAGQQEFSQGTVGPSGQLSTLTTAR